MSLTDECKIIMPTCDKYLHLLAGNMFLLDHFWPDHPKVYVIGFKEPTCELDPDKWEFVSMGEDMGKGSWGNMLRDFFEKHGDKIGDYFIHMNDDAPPLQEINADMLSYIFDYVKSDPKIGRATLSGARGYVKNNPSTRSHYKDIEGGKYKLGEVPSSGPYRTSIANDLWNKKFFLKHLKPNLSSWAFETQHPKNDGFRVISTAEAPPIVFCHIYRNSGYFDTTWYKNKGHGGTLPEDLKKKYIELTGLDTHPHKFWNK